MVSIKYNLDNYDVTGVSDYEIIKDILKHMHRILPECELKKVSKRRKANQALYGVAKAFGYRSAYRDLNLWHSSLEKVFPSDGEWIPIPEIGKISVYYHLMLLGRESKKAYASTSMKDRLSGNSTMANQIEINVRGKREIMVEMELTGPAFFNVCHDFNSRSVGKVIKDKLKSKWGSTGTKYGLYTPENGRSTEEYKIVRLHDGIPKCFMKGMGLVTHSAPRFG